MTTHWDITINGRLWLGESVRYPGDEGLYYETEDGVYEVSLDLQQPGAYTWIEVREADLPTLVALPGEAFVAPAEMAYIKKELDK